LQCKIILFTSEGQAWIATTNVKWKYWAKISFKCVILMSKILHKLRIFL
jgi:hypothetical protein